MVLHALEHDTELTNADNARHHADLELVGLQPVALLDVGFQIAGIRLRIDHHARPACEARLAQRIAQGNAGRAVHALVDVALRQLTARRTAAQKEAEVPLLVAPGADIDAVIRKSRIGLDRPRRLQRIDDAQRPIEPPGIVLALQMRPRKDLAPLRPREPKHVPNAVDDGLVPERIELSLQPLQRLHVLGRQ